MRILIALLIALGLAGCDFSALFTPPPPEATPPRPPDVIVRDIEILGAPAETPDRQPWDGGFQSPAPDVYAEIVATESGESVRTRTFGNVYDADFPLRDSTFFSILLTDASQPFTVTIRDDDSGGFSNDDDMWISPPFAFTDLASVTPATYTFTDLDDRPRVRVRFEFVTSDE